MHESIVLVDADDTQRRALCAALERERYRVIPLQSLTKLKRKIQEGDCKVVVLDLESLPVDNRLFRELKRKNPGVCIIGLSSRPFHPELEEAMSNHIHACLAKPVDDEELVFWVRSLGNL